MEKTPDPSSDLSTRAMGNRVRLVAVSVAVSIGLSAATTIALARWLGATEYGRYALLMSWVAVLASFSTAGLENGLVRQVPAYVVARAWGLLRGFLTWASSATAVSSVLAATAALVVWRLTPRISSALSVLLVAATLVPLTAFLRVQHWTLRGLGHPALGRLADTIVVPVLVLAMIGAHALTSTSPASAANAISVQLTASVAALAMTLVLMWRLVPREVQEATPSHERKLWRASGLRLALLTGLAMLGARVALLILGAVADPAVVGLYAAALQVSLLASVSLNVVNAAMARTLSAAHASGDRAGFRRTSLLMTRFSLLGALPVAIGLVLAGRPLLRVFGPAFESAYAALVILVVGELVNAGAGPVATLLIMTGHERDALIGLGVSTLVCTGLGVWLAPSFGIVGAAVATATGVSLWNIILWQFVRRRLAFGYSLRDILRPADQTTSH